MKRLQGKVAIVTGAARGLGASIARRFHDEGALLLLGDVRDADGREFAKGFGANAQYVHLDVASEDDWGAAISEVRSRFGIPSILVNNAAVFRVATLLQTSAEEYLQMVRINQLGCFLGMRHCAQAMLQARAGSIVNIASTAGLEGVGGAVAYTATKHAVVGMTKAAALELGGHGIRVNAVCPGAMATPMLGDSFKVSAETLRSMDLPRSPMRRMASPEEITGAVLYLASDESSYATGSTLVVDGGITAGVMSETGRERD